MEKLLIGLGVATLVLVVAFWAVAIYTAWSLAKTDRKPVTITPAQWSLDYESISFSPRDDDSLVLRGWYLPGVQDEKLEKGASIIMVHGKGQNRHTETALAAVAPFLVSQAYNVLVFDLRGQGESGGSRFSLGDLERWDVVGAVDHLKSRDNSPRPIGVYALSMGAASSLLAAAETRDIKAVMSDSAYANAREILDLRLPGESPLPSFLYDVLLLGVSGFGHFWVREIGVKKLLV